MALDQGCCGFFLNPFYVFQGKLPVGFALCDRIFVKTVETCGIHKAEFCRGDSAQLKQSVLRSYGTVGLTVKYGAKVDTAGGVA